MLKSPATNMFSYLFMALSRVLVISSKNISLFDSYGGLYTNIKNHFLLEIVNSRQIVSGSAVSNSVSLLAINPSFT